MMLHATGEFQVDLVSQTNPEEVPLFGRMTINKRFTGDLEATSKGQMLSAGTSEPTSAGYVAIERVEGKLGGRIGSFFLQHSGSMDRGIPRLTIEVVPDSGTGELAGLTGSLAIEIKEGKHFYAFEYQLS